MSEQGTSEQSPAFFDSPGALRRWYEALHGDAAELWLGFHKKGSGLPSPTYQEALDEALCFGWIDGIRKSRDDRSYVQRFSPRRDRSIWSNVNIRRMEQLIAEGRVAPAGLEAFERRDPQRSGVYSFERENAALDKESGALFRANAAAWDFWERQSPSYRKVASWWVISAKREDTRRKRLTTLIDDSASGRRIDLLNPRSKG